MDVNTGIPDVERNQIADGLAQLLADTYTLYLKTHGYHWNVTGPMFQTLHLMFEDQYTELSAAVDVIAERIRALGVQAPGSYSELARLSTVADEDDVPEAMEMIRRLVDGHEVIVRTARELVGAAEAARDVATADLVTTRIDSHEKTAWMLRSMAS